MLFLLVIRNIPRHVPRLYPVLIAILLAFAVLVAGNGILSWSYRALYRTWAHHVSADLSISAVGSAQFSLFGPETFLVGEYLVAPTITRYGELRRVLGESRHVDGAAGVVSAAARVEIASRGANRVLFGVDFREYFQLFPDLELRAGTVPPPGEPGLVVQAPGADDSQMEELIGTMALLTVARGESFTIREVPVTGVFAYPVRDRALDRVALVDADTARALNGYVVAPAAAEDLPEESRRMLGSDLDDLFGDDLFEEDLFADGPDGANDTPGTPRDTPGADDTPLDTVEPRDALGELELFFSRTDEETRAARMIDDGAWNFVLVSLRSGSTVGEVTRYLERHGFSRDGGYRIRDWRRTVGGSTLILMVLQVLFNGGLLFITLGAAIVAANGLVLSILERTVEIGTLRALGATRARVTAMVVLETVLSVTLAGVAGIFLGVLLVQVVNGAAFVPSNYYLSILFGGGPVRGQVTGVIVLSHLAGVVVISLLASVYPLRRSLKITPVLAMAERAS